MKILLLDLGKIIRGGQRQVYYLARSLTQSPDFEPLVVIPKNTPLQTFLEDADIPHICIPSSSDLNPWNIFCFLRIVATFQPAIIHTNDAKGASLGALAKKWLGEFTLVHSRRVSYKLKSGWGKKKYLLGDAIVAVSREIYEVLVECGIPEDKATVIHSGIDAELYSTEKHNASRLTLGAVGALSSQKGFEVLIEALAELKKNTSMPDWQCLIAGDGPLLQQLKKQAEQLGLAESILFLGYKDSKEVLPQIDILAVPSVDGEGSNAVIKEGWASGTPVITSDLQSNLELVTHAYDGLIFRNRNAKELADALVQIATDPTLAQQLVKNGSKTVDKFTDNIMADRYMKLYKQLTA